MNPDIFKAHAPVLIYQFKWPKTRKIDLIQSYAPAMGRNQDAIDRMKLVQEFRDALGETMAKKNKIAKEVMQACEAYFPHMYSLVMAIETSKGTMRQDPKYPVTYTWSSALAKDAAHSDYIPVEDIQFEAIMVCLVYGIAHISRASEITISCPDDDFDERAAEAVKYLKTAAGIFDYVVERELPRWKPVPEVRPLETSGPVIKALSTYALSMAQACLVKKALLGGKTSRLVMAKLQVQVWKDQEAFAKILRALPAWKDNKIQVIFKSFLDLQVGLAKSNSYRYSGENEYENDKIGRAVKFLELAHDALAKVWTPNPNSTLGRYTEDIDKAKYDIEHKRREYDNENNHVQLQKVPIEAELDLPEAKSLVTAEAWMPPRPNWDKLIA